MKRVLIVTLLGSSAALFSFASGDIKVPAAANNAFAKAHPGVTGKWEKEGVNYEVNFKEAGKTMSCVIQGQGTILETETDITVNELPATVAAYIKAHYKGAKIKDAARIVKNSGEVNFEAGINHKDVLFDQSGKFIKEVKD